MINRSRADTVEITLDFDGKLSVTVNGRQVVHVNRCIEVQVKQPGSEPGVMAQGIHTFNSNKKESNEEVQSKD